MTRAPEVWRPIPGWAALYEVSSHGRVRSLDRIDRLGRLHRGRVLKYSARKSGDIRVNLYRCGKLHRAYVARLVALTFLDEGEPGQRAMHVNADRKNNAYENLKWADPSAIARKRKTPKKTARGHFHPTPVVAISLTTGETTHFKSQAEAVRAGFSQSCIAACLRGVTLSHRGFRWLRAAQNTEQKHRDRM